MQLRLNGGLRNASSRGGRSTDSLCFSFPFVLFVYFCDKTGWERRWWWGGEFRSLGALAPCDESRRLSGDRAALVCWSIIAQPHMCTHTHARMHTRAGEGTWGWGGWGWDFSLGWTSRREITCTHLARVLSHVVQMVSSDEEALEGVQHRDLKQPLMNVSKRSDQSSEQTSLHIRRLGGKKKRDNAALCSAFCYVKDKRRAWKSHMRCAAGNYWR